jgi:hypothetical protein
MYFQWRRLADRGYCEHGTEAAELADKSPGDALEIAPEQPQGSAAIDPGRGAVTTSP